MREAVERCGLDLEGAAVLTEAATGAYAVTAPIAALAGAQVTALARDSRYGSARDAEDAVMGIARAAGVAERVSVIRAVPKDLSSYGIVTNSGHLRPIDSAMIARLPPDAVIALMFEAWELREGDIDIDACRARGIRIAAVNERHAAVDVFSYLGPMALRALQDAGIACYGGRIALLCDNDFGPSILRSLSGTGMEVEVFTEVATLRQGTWDAVLVALHPRAEPRIDRTSAARLSEVAADAAIVQIWGDIDRAALAAYGFEAWPPQAPRAGHMAVLLSDIGPEAVVRLQTGGLAAAACVRRGEPVTPNGMAELV